ncbi:murein L,D-transpeptidase catalytic domain family protein [Hymenobacter sp. NBH84]|uniref:murein L,D-transpeptidase catalytic domain family protein n=1 Tax=Hymenobacter sp. NBH84 TaxID=2596915 RepID=UPI001628D021|nr:murein L,D-transpeptidase catalytic domain family protein [Hymenobacter sp. NBH84]QNE39297.1 murein L,D-transpeptidase catalytic domain family protein [Hymenobacter sp. NBH84]
MSYLPTVSASLLLSALSFLPTNSAPVAAAPAPTAVVVEAPSSRALATAAFEQHILQSYAQSGLVTSGLPVLVFREALIGFYNLRQQGKIAPDQHVLTVIDFSQSSKAQRFWVIDLEKQRLLFRTLVAHGKNTGEDLARTFSNREGSEMSSLGFYRTGRTYQGKHGLSLKLHGLDTNYNTNAYNRAVVVHGASYVSEDFVRQHGRLGRSQGCPALPVGESSDIIRAIKNGSVVYAHGPAQASYASNWLNLEPAVLAFAGTTGRVVAGQ